MQIDVDQSARLTEVLAGSGVGDALRLRIVEWAEDCLEQAYDEGRDDGYGDGYDEGFEHGKGSEDEN